MPPNPGILVEELLQKITKDPKSNLKHVIKRLRTEGFNRRHSFDTQLGEVVHVRYIKPQNPPGKRPFFILWTRTERIKVPSGLD